MTLSNPEIGDATGYWNSSNNSGDIIILWNNTGGRGYVRIQAGDYNTGTVHNTFVDCPAIKTGLYWLGLSPMQNVFNFGFVKAYRCKSNTQQNCDISPPTCSQIILTSPYLDFPIRAIDLTTPPIPTGLNVTPGDRSLTFTWDAVSNPNVFAYYLVLTDPNTNIIESGYRRLDQSRSYTFTNLINGTIYTFHLRTISHSNVMSSEATKSGTPQQPITLTTVTISPTTASVGVGGTQIFTATAKDQNNNPMAGIILSWLSSDVSKATISPTSGTTDSNGETTATLTGVAADSVILYSNGSPGATNGPGIANVTVECTTPVIVMTIPT